MEPTPRERKRDPHTCGGCGARFDVAYFDDRADSPPALCDLACPRCGKPKSVALPQGAERTLQVEVNETEAEEGVGD